MERNLREEFKDVLNYFSFCLTLKKARLLNRRFFVSRHKTEKQGEDDTQTRLMIRVMQWTSHRRSFVIDMDVSGHRSFLTESDLFLNDDLSRATVIIYYLLERINDG